MRHQEILTTYELRRMHEKSGNREMECKYVEYPRQCGPIERRHVPPVIEGSSGRAGIKAPEHVKGKIAS